MVLGYFSYCIMTQQTSVKCKFISHWYNRPRVKSSKPVSLPLLVIPLGRCLCLHAWRWSTMISMSHQRKGGGDGVARTIPFKWHTSLLPPSHTDTLNLSVKKETTGYKEHYHLLQGSKRDQSRKQLTRPPISGRIPLWKVPTYLQARQGWGRERGDIFVGVMHL